MLTFQSVKEMFLAGYLNAPENDPTFQQVAEGMLAYWYSQTMFYFKKRSDKDGWQPTWKSHVKEQFEERKILGTTAVAEVSCISFSLNFAAS